MSPALSVSSRNSADARISPPKASSVMREAKMTPGRGNRRCRRVRPQPRCTERDVTFIGRSRICDPLGKTIATADEECETILYADIDLARPATSI
jgi:predicted amidohydrolase